MDLAKTSNDIPVEKSQQLEDTSEKEEKNDDVDVVWLATPFA